MVSLSMWKLNVREKIKDKFDIKSIEQLNFQS